MKQILILITSAGLLFGCEAKIHLESKPNSPETIEKAGKFPGEMKVVEIDNCEYLEFWKSGGSGQFSITHKGNCKFCAERAGILLTK